MKTVLLTGATGFVGARVLPKLVNGGFFVRAASRHPDAATRAHPAQHWVELDVSRPETVHRALHGCDAAVYLVHGMAEGAGYEERDREAAVTFARAAAEQGVERIVYLGGVAPQGHPSRHLQSRLHTGELLRAGPVPVFELRAAMIVGRGGVSWQMVRDLAVRLPAMLLPRWLETRSQPVAVDDVVYAITQALRLPIERAGVYDLPGPETLSAKEILLRIASLRGTRPLTVSVPVLSPRLSSYWLKLVTRANYQIARELVEGLSGDLVASGRPFWEIAPPHMRKSFDEAARQALIEEDEVQSLPIGWLEKALTKVSRHPRA